MKIFTLKNTGSLYFPKRPHSLGQKISNTVFSFYNYFHLPKSFQMMKNYHFSKPSKLSKMSCSNSTKRWSSICPSRNIFTLQKSSALKCLRFIKVSSQESHLFVCLSSVLFISLKTSWLFQTCPYFLQIKFLHFKPSQRSVSHRHSRASACLMWEVSTCVCVAVNVG